MLPQHRSAAHQRLPLRPAQLPAQDLRQQRRQRIAPLLPTGYRHQQRRGRGWSRFAPIPELPQAGHQPGQQRRQPLAAGIPAQGQKLPAQIPLIGTRRPPGQRLQAGQAIWGQPQLFVQRRLQQPLQGQPLQQPMPGPAGLTGGGRRAERALHRGWGAGCAQHCHRGVAALRLCVAMWLRVAAGPAASPPGCGGRPRCR
jgi:hypothetical protein